MTFNFNLISITFLLFKLLCTVWLWKMSEFHCMEWRPKNKQKYLIDRLIFIYHTFVLVYVEFKLGKKNKQKPQSWWFWLQKIAKILEGLINAITASVIKMLSNWYDYHIIHIYGLPKVQMRMSELSLLRGFLTLLVVHFNKLVVSLSHASPLSQYWLDFHPWCNHSEIFSREQPSLTHWPEWDVMPTPLSRSCSCSCSHSLSLCPFLPWSFSFFFSFSDWSHPHIHACGWVERGRQASYTFWKEGFSSSRRSHLSFLYHTLSIHTHTHTHQITPFIHTHAHAHAHTHTCTQSCNNPPVREIVLPCGVGILDPYRSYIPWSGGDRRR